MLLLCNSYLVHRTYLCPDILIYALHTFKSIFLKNKIENSGFVHHFAIPMLLIITNNKRVKPRKWNVIGEKSIWQKLSSKQCSKNIILWLEIYNNLFFLYMKKNQELIFFKKTKFLKEFIWLIRNLERI